MSDQRAANSLAVDLSDGFLCFCMYSSHLWRKVEGDKCYHGEYVQGVKPHLFGHSMSSMVSGRGTPLVSGNRRTSPPATNARAPVRVNIDFTNLTLELEHAQHHFTMARSVMHLFWGGTSESHAKIWSTENPFNRVSVRPGFCDNTLFAL